jgi:hypothetical protein
MTINQNSQLILIKKICIYTLMLLIELMDFMFLIKTALRDTMLKFYRSQL